MFFPGPVWFLAVRSPLRWAAAMARTSVGHALGLGIRSVSNMKLPHDYCMLSARKRNKVSILDCSQKNSLPLFICWYLTYIIFASIEGMRCQDRLWQIWHQDCLYSFELGHCNTSLWGPVLNFLQALCCIQWMSDYCFFLLSPFDVALCHIWGVLFRACNE